MLERVKAKLDELYPKALHMKGASNEQKGLSEANTTVA